MTEKKTVYLYQSTVYMHVSENHEKHTNTQSHT